MEDRGRSFWRREEGQDLIEYSLLLAFVCLAGAAMFVGIRGGTQNLWENVNGHLAAANTSN